MQRGLCLCILPDRGGEPPTPCTHASLPTLLGHAALPARPPRNQFTLTPPVATSGGRRWTPWASYGSSIVARRSRGGQRNVWHAGAALGRGSLPARRSTHAAAGGAGQVAGAQHAAAAAAQHGTPAGQQSQAACVDSPQLSLLLLLLAPPLVRGAIAVAAPAVRHARQRAAVRKSPAF